MKRGTNGKAGDDACFDVENLLQSGGDSGRWKVREGKIVEKVPVPLLCGRQPLIERLHRACGERVGDEFEAFAPSRLDDRKNDQAIEEVFGVLASAEEGHQRLHVGIGVIFPEDTASGEKELVHLAKVRELFAGEVDHGDDDVRVFWVVVCKLEGAPDDLALGMGVIAEKGVDVGKDRFRPLGSRLMSQ
jgi:hypothetical protein